MQDIQKYFLNNGLSVWTDKNIKPGSSSWLTSITQAIKNAGCLTVILSPDAANSEWVEKEVHFAKIQGKPIFVVLAVGDEKDSIPFYLSTDQRVDIRNKDDYESGLETLVEAIREKLNLTPMRSNPNLGKVPTDNIYEKNKGKERQNLKLNDTADKESLILIVDDDSRARNLVKINLQQHPNYSVVEASNVEEAITIMERGLPDLVILDLGFSNSHSDKSGIEVSKWVRFEQNNYTLPIIVLSGRNEQNIVEEALDAGADDFVKKPFTPSELMARIRAVLRRSNPPVPAPGTQDEVRLEGLTIDIKSRRAYVAGRDIKLTHTEFALLAALAQEKDHVLSHDELLSRVWGDQYQDAIHYLHVYLGRIRKKMGEHQVLLETAPGMGYVLHSKTPGE